MSAAVHPAQDLCVLALRSPEVAAAQWQAAEWNRFLPQARSAGLLARAAVRVRAALSPDREAAFPAPLAGHLESSRRMFAAQRAEIERELIHLQRALVGLDVPVILLKGAAYLAAGLPAAEDRFFSDVDILVPKSALGEVESNLMLHGWLTTHHDPYDQRYYREWMHELPPMQHVHRGTTLDVHHTIAPETGRLHPDAVSLIAASRALPNHSALRVLAPADMVLHSMTHLFLNDDMSHALRDLSDLDLLLRHFARSDPDFWSALIERAQALGLTRPLYYGLRYCAPILDTPIPPDIAEYARGHGPAWALMRAWMDWIWQRALASPHSSAVPAGQGFALFALYLRGHWLRMPPALLLKHLTIKAMRRRALDKAGPQPVRAQP
jgi:hypothetical protein